MKSIHTRFHEVLGKLTKKQLSQFHTWRESVTTDSKYPAVEAQLNAIEAILSGEHKESAPIVKNNGAADNGRVLLVESDEQPDVLAKAHNLCNKYVTLHKLSEADARKVVGLPSQKREQTNLNERQYRFFELSVLAGRDERSALATAKLS